MSEKTFFLDIILHVGRLIVYLLEDLLLSSNSVLLLLDKPVLDALDLSPDWIQVIIMILDSVVSLLIYH